MTVNILAIIFTASILLISAVIDTLYMKKMKIKYSKDSKVYKAYIHGAKMGATKIFLITFLFFFILLQLIMHNAKPNYVPINYDSINTIDTVFNNNYHDNNCDTTIVDNNNLN